MIGNFSRSFERESEDLSTELKNFLARNTLLKQQGDDKLLKTTATRSHAHLLQEIRGIKKKNLLDISKHPPSALLSAIRSHQANEPGQKTKAKSRNELMQDIRDFDPTLELVMSPTRNVNKVLKSIRSFQSRGLKKRVPKNRRKLLMNIRQFEKSKLINRDYLAEEIQFFQRNSLTRSVTIDRNDLLLERAKIFVALSTIGQEVGRVVNLTRKTKNFQALLSDIRGFNKKNLKKRVPKNMTRLRQQIRENSRSNKLVPWESHLNLIQTFQKTWLCKVYGWEISMPYLSATRDAFVFHVTDRRLLCDLVDNGEPKDRSHLMTRIRQKKKLRPRKRDTRCFQTFLQDIRTFKRSNLKQRNLLMREIRHFDKIDLNNGVPWIHDPTKRTSDTKYFLWIKTLGKIQAVDKFVLLDSYGTKDFQAVLSEIRTTKRSDVLRRANKPLDIRELHSEIRKFVPHEKLRDWKELNNQIEVFKKWKLRCEVTSGENNYLDRVVLLKTIDAISYTRIAGFNKVTTRIYDPLQRVKLLESLKRDNKLALLSVSCFSHRDLMNEIRDVRSRMNLKVLWNEPKSRTNLMREIRDFELVCLWPVELRGGTQNIQLLLQSLRGNSLTLCECLLDQIKEFQAAKSLKKCKTFDYKQLLRDIRSFEQNNLKKRKKMLSEIIMFDLSFLSHPVACVVKNNLERECLMKHIRSPDLKLNNKTPEMRSVQDMLQEIRLRRGRTRL